MPFCLVCFLRKFRCSEQIDLEQQSPFSPDLATELEDSRRFSLNSLMALLGILTISGSKMLQPVAFTLLIYTINLRLATSTCFLHNHPTWSRFLHVIPLLGTFCTAIVGLISNTESPALATTGVLLGVLPFATVVIHHGAQCAVQGRIPNGDEGAPVPSVPGSAGATSVSH